MPLAEPGMKTVFRRCSYLDPMPAVPHRAASPRALREAPKPVQVLSHDICQSMITMCPRGDSQLRYMIPIALTTEFVIEADSAR